MVQKVQVLFYCTLVGVLSACQNQPKQTQSHRDTAKRSIASVCSGMDSYIRDIDPFYGNMGAKISAAKDQMIVNCDGADAKSIENTARAIGKRLNAFENNSVKGAKELENLCDYWSSNKSSDEFLGCTLGAIEGVGSSIDPFYSVSKSFITAVEKLAIGSKSRKVMKRAIILLGETENNFASGVYNHSIAAKKRITVEFSNLTKAPPVITPQPGTVPSGKWSYQTKDYDVCVRGSCRTVLHGATVTNNDGDQFAVLCSERDNTYRVVVKTHHDRHEDLFLKQIFAVVTVNGVPRAHNLRAAEVAKSDFFLGLRPIRQKFIDDLKRGSVLRVLVNDETNRASYFEFALTDSTPAINAVKYCQAQ